MAADPTSSTPDSGLQTPDFRWIGFFQRSTQALFVLSRRRQILFVNRAWEQLAGLTAREVRMQVCKRQRDPEAGTCEALLHLLAPPREAQEGKPTHIRRLLLRRDAPPCWWDVEFIPILGDKGVLGILGRVHVDPTAMAITAQPLPEKLINLRLRLADWCRLAHLPTQIPPMRRVMEQARLASHNDSPVLILGEPGSGKEWLARAIHQEGQTKHHPFVSLDCRHLSAAAPTWILFGNPRLATQRGATLYLREPSYLPRELQARLCEKIANTDDDAPRPRLLAGSGVDPIAEVQAGRLMEEFHCLLSPLTIQLPPLRDHLADLPVLVDRLLRRATTGRETPVSGLTDEAWELVRAYSWPGNLRELYTVLANACSRAKGDKLHASDLPWLLRSTPPAPERSLPLDQLLEQAERRLIQWALTTTQGNKSKAADLLKISRQRLLRRIEALGI